MAKRGLRCTARLVYCFLFLSLSLSLCPSVLLIDRFLAGEIAAISPFSPSPPLPYLAASFCPFLSPSLNRDFDFLWYFLGNNVLAATPPSRLFRWWDCCLLPAARITVACPTPSSRRFCCHLWRMTAEVIAADPVGVDIFWRVRSF